MPRSTAIWPIRMSVSPSRGLVDTNVVILRSRLQSEVLPDELAISAITLAELSAGVAMVRGDDLDARLERAARTTVLQRTESEFEPIPFDAAAARVFGSLSAAVQATGRTPRRRATDLMIAATAAAHGLTLFTTNPRDFIGLERLVEIVAVERAG